MNKRMRTVLLLTLTMIVGGSVFGLTASAEAPAAPQPPAVEEESGGGCCGGASDGWLIEALQSVERTDLVKAFADIDKHGDAKALLDTPEAATIRKIVETGKLPEVTLDEWRKLENSPRTWRLIRALFTELRVNQYLTA